MLVHWPKSCAKAGGNTPFGKGAYPFPARQAPDNRDPSRSPVRSGRTTPTTPDPHTATRSSRARPQQRRGEGIVRRLQTTWVSRDRIACNVSNPRHLRDWVSVTLPTVSPRRRPGSIHEERHDHRASGRRRRWIPACAGMTLWWSNRLRPQSITSPLTGEVAEPGPKVLAALGGVRGWLDADCSPLPSCAMSLTLQASLPSPRRQRRLSAGGQDRSNCRKSRLSLLSPPFSLICRPYV